MGEESDKFVILFILLMIGATGTEEMALKILYLN